MLSFSSAYKSTFFIFPNWEIAKFHAKTHKSVWFQSLAGEQEQETPEINLKNYKNKIFNYFAVKNLTDTHTETNQHKHKQERFTTEYGKCAWKQIDKWKTQTHTL